MEVRGGCKRRRQRGIASEGFDAAVLRVVIHLGQDSVRRTAEASIAVAADLAALTGVRLLEAHRKGHGQNTESRAAERFERIGVFGLEKEEMDGRRKAHGPRRNRGVVVRRGVRFGRRNAREGRHQEPVFRPVGYHG